jgi:hypothetical protein
MERLLSQALIKLGGEAAEAVGLPQSFGERAGEFAASEGRQIARKTKKRASPYARKYKAAFKKISKKYKLKNGKWKKNGFRLAVKHAHRIAGGKK